MRHLPWQPDKLACCRLEPSIPDDECHHAADDEDGFVLAGVDVEIGT
jgi:hypothetical protein